MELILNGERSLENCPFPAILCDEKGLILDRNRASRDLFPALRRKTSFKRFGVFPEAGSIRTTAFSASGEILYVGKARKDGREAVLYCFIQDLTVLESSVREDLLEKGDFVFRKLDAALSRFFARRNERTEKAVKRAAADNLRLQESRRAYLRFLKLTARSRKISALSPRQILLRIAELLEGEGIRLNVAPDSPRAVIRTDPETFFAIVLNLVLFVRSFENQSRIEAAVRSEKDEVFLEFSFADPARLFDACGGVLTGRGGGAALFLPLLCVWALCRREKAGFSLEKEGRNGKVRLIFPACRKLPELFLAASSREEQCLSEWIGALFGSAR